MNETTTKTLMMLCALGLAAGCTGRIELDGTPGVTSGPGGSGEGGEVVDDPKPGQVGPPPVTTPITMPPEPETPLAEITSIPPTPRVLRLDRHGYMSTVATLFDGRAPDGNEEIEEPGGISEPFGWINPSDRFSTLYRSYIIDGTEFAVVELNARVASKRWVDTLDEQTCMGTDLGDDDCQRMLIEDAGSFLLRRPLTELEIDSAMSVRPEDMGASSRRVLELRIASLMMHPAFLFRTELGEEGGPGTVQRLELGELANALSFTLLDQPPDEALYQSVIDGSLADPEVYAGHVDRLLASPLHTARVKDFAHQFWRYGEARNVAKDEKPEDVFPEGTEGAGDAKYRPQDFVAETNMLVDKIVDESLHQDFLATMLTTTEGFIDKDTAIFYNRSSESGDPELVTFAPDERRGIMTQPSWLVAFSETDHTNPIRRGLFIQESLLCGEVPDIPIDDVPLLDYKTQTMREALAEHSPEGTTCYGCHTMMDPLGLPLEQFDHFGRKREMEQGRPVEVHGFLRWSRGDFAEAGEVSDPFQMAERLADSRTVEHCFMQHAFEYWIGRKPTGGDARAIEAARRAYTDSGGDFDAAMKAILTSDVYLLRTLPN